MNEWIYFIHSPRDDFAATMNDDEQAVFGAHFGYLQQLLAQGKLILAGPTLGTINTGVCVIEAEDEAAATQIMNADPFIASGLTKGELRPFRAALLRGRDHAATPVFSTETRQSDSPSSVTV
ncbi:YciI family protein [Catellatospora sp. KI3]|uniref:YciI family protein n=1 Tax=Catellatospora sp. KI3 TaxID=3041620 RepID=UPI002482EDD4|nr:YciI family protein [Catellatospora sp. KI3]MDI1461502.1 YciI family protein [Catellatospora sp. KI3]